MATSLRVTPLEGKDDRRFLDYLERDRVLHIFTIYDWRYMREKTKVWVAYRNDEISGYVFEYDGRIVHTHGDEESIAELLPFVSLDEPIFIIEPHHLATVEKFFKPVEPLDAQDGTEITTFLVMKANVDTFKPKIRHQTKKLEAEDLDEVLQSLGEEYRERVKNAIQRGAAYGAYENRSLVSLATVPEIIENTGLIRGVYTTPSLRRRGLATSACSALVAEMLRLGKEPMLWVSRGNLPARKVYEKIGFRETGLVLLGFKAERL